MYSRPNHLSIAHSNLKMATVLIKQNSVNAEHASMWHLQASWIFLTRAEICRGIRDSVTIFPSIGTMFYPKTHKYLMQSETNGIIMFN